jgi:PIN domain nuclease of toxin-antitoxin system
MVVLLDTHILIWSLNTPKWLSQEAQDILTDPNNEIFFSAASIWEIAIKAALKRFDFHYRPNDIAAAARQIGMVEIGVSSCHAGQVADLPLIHNDPFDRLLIAQALSIPARLFTADTLLARYSDLVQPIKIARP